MRRRALSLRVLIAPDKFKGSLSACGAAEAIARGWRRVRPQDTTDLLPITDGGDGFGEILGHLLGGRAQTVPTVDAAHRPCLAKWWWVQNRQIAIIESANVIGISMLVGRKYHPFVLDTFGLGSLVRAASTKGARRCLIGIGGSATNDGGFGVARSLGWKFFRHNDGLIERWIDLNQLDHVRAPQCSRWFDELVVAVDVQNPLLGAAGATRTFGPQKGLKPQEIPYAERRLRTLAKIVRAGPRRVSPAMRGGGAAGGLGFGLCSFLGGELKPGFDLFAECSSLDERLCSADLVITGEGKIDASTFMGKGVGQIALLCRKRRVPCIAVGGTIAEPALASHHFESAHALTDLTTMTNAKSRAPFWLERLAELTARFGAT